MGAPRVQPHEHCFDVPVQDIDPAQPVYQVRRLQDWLEESAAEPRATTTLSGVFALVALLLAAVGVCGVLSYSVARRTQGIGVRMAIGAERAQIMRLVLRGGMAWAFSGITIGLVGAFALSRVLRTLLFEVGPRDPITYSTVGVMLALVAMLACYLPAARATRIDPMIALRTEQIRVRTNHCKPGRGRGRSESGEYPGRSLGLSDQSKGFNTWPGSGLLEILSC